MARLRGFERFNDPLHGADLVIKKLNPGVDEGIGYLVSIFQDGSFKDKLKITSKKKLKDLIDEFKAFYHTDKAFLNGMLFHITYKNEKELPTPRKQLSEEEKKIEDDHKKLNEGKEAMSNIDNVLYKKAALIERKLNRLFQPSLPLIRTAAEATDQSDNQTLEFIKQCKEKIDAFADENKDLMNSPDSYKLYNAMERWVSEVNEQLDTSPDLNVDIDQVKQELANYFSNYTFLREKHTASSTVIITDDNIEQLLDSLDNAVNDNTTDKGIEEIVEVLNGVSGASDTQIENAVNISDEIPKAVIGNEPTKICIATEDVVDMLVKRFRDDVNASKYSGSLQDAVIDWAVKNNIDARYAELTFKFCEADFSPDRSKLRYAAMASVGMADSAAKDTAVEDFIKAVNDVTINYPDSSADYTPILQPYLAVVCQSVHDDVYMGNKFTDVVNHNLNTGVDCSILLNSIAPDRFTNIAAAMQAHGNDRSVIDNVNNDINNFIKANIDTAAGGLFKKWVMDTALAFGLKYGATTYQAEYDEMLKTL